MLRLAIRSRETHKRQDMGPDGIGLPPTVDHERRWAALWGPPRLQYPGSGLLSLFASRTGALHGAVAFEKRHGRYPPKRTYEIVMGLSTLKLPVAAPSGSLRM